MIGNLYRTFGRKLMFSLDAETAHGASITALKAGIYPPFDNARDKRLAVDVAGLHFPNPLGMAAGFDKGGDAPNALLAMGFGHTEVGTITPNPQSGNPKPRVFRLVRDNAVVNRLGFNSEGHAAVLARLIERRKAKSGLVGINIGANKTSEDFAADYVTGIEVFAALADYFTVNISSPNTLGLRALQGKHPLADLMSRVEVARDAQAEMHGRRVPLFLKIAPDLDETELDSIAEALAQSAFDGLIVSNTTLSRTGLASSNANETGGLSGRPLFERSTIVLAKMAQRVGENFPLIGVGGVNSGATALSKIEAGAHLVQLYTGMIYAGPGLPADIDRHLSKILDGEGLSSIGELRGRKRDEWAVKAIPPS